MCYLRQLLQPGNGAICALVNIVNNINTKIWVNVLIFNILTILASIYTQRIVNMFCMSLNALNTLYFMTFSIAVNRLGIIMIIFLKCSNKSACGRNNNYKICYSFYNQLLLQMFALPNIFPFLNEIKIFYYAVYIKSLCYVISMQDCRTVLTCFRSILPLIGTLLCL